MRNCYFMISRLNNCQEENLKSLYYMYSSNCVIFQKKSVKKKVLFKSRENFLQNLVFAKLLYVCSSYFHVSTSGKNMKKNFLIEWRHNFNTLNVDSYRQSGLVAIKLDEKNSFKKKTWGLLLMKKCNYIFHFPSLVTVVCMCNSTCQVT